MAKTKHSSPFLISSKRKRSKKNKFNKKSKIAKLAEQEPLNTILADDNALGPVSSSATPGQPKKTVVPNANKENAAPSDTEENSFSCSNSALLVGGTEGLVKQELRSRDVSVFSARPSGTIDGWDSLSMMGQPLNRFARAQIEANSCVQYPFPRHTPFNGRCMYSKGRTLDLMLDGEVDGGGEEDVNTDYRIDCILAMNRLAALIDWESYRFPTWEAKQRVSQRGAAILDYNRRWKIIDPLCKKVYNSMPACKFISLYPNQGLFQTTDYEEYVKHPGILYISGLRKRERQINDCYDKRYGRSTEKDHNPMIIFEDWTDFHSSFIPTFEYLVDSEMTDEAAAIEADLTADQTICACSNRCDGEQGCCEYKAKTNIAYVRKAQLGNTIPHNNKDNDHGDFENSPDCVDVYECGDACTCDRETCMQRVLQKGHRNTLICFMHHEKSWTMVAGNDLKSGAFVCEYVGVMMSVKEALAKTDRTYQIELSVKSKSGHPRMMVIDALKKGNEARFFSHSCEPNLFTYRIHYDIEGRPKRHIGLFASRDIDSGEELTFDYYAGIKDPVEFHNITKFICKCGSPNCREKAYQALLKKSIKVES